MMGRLAGLLGLALLLALVVGCGRYGPPLRTPPPPVVAPVATPAAEPQVDEEEDERMEEALGADSLIEEPATTP
jgi:predicted small lipoprotein YifL